MGPALVNSSSVAAAIVSAFRLAGVVTIMIKSSIGRSANSYVHGTTFDRDTKTVFDVRQQRRDLELS